MTVADHGNNISKNVKDDDDEEQKSEEEKKKTYRWNNQSPSIQVPITTVCEMVKRKKYRKNYNQNMEKKLKI